MSEDSVNGTNATDSVNATITEIKNTSFPEKITEKLLFELDSTSLIGFFIAVAAVVLTIGELTYGLLMLIASEYRPVCALGERTCLGVVLQLEVHVYVSFLYFVWCHSNEERWAISRNSPLRGLFFASLKCRNKSIKAGCYLFK